MPFIASGRQGSSGSMTRRIDERESVLAVPVAAVNGLFTARSVAKIYAAIAEGGTIDGKELFSLGAINRMSRVQVKTRDRVIPVRMGWRLGYHAAFTNRGQLRSTFGHFGFGGSGRVGRSLTQTLRGYGEQPGRRDDATIGKEKSARTEVRAPIFLLGPSCA
jgi:hypothetical protein